MAKAKKSAAKPRTGGTKKASAKPRQGVIAKPRISGITKAIVKPRTGGTIKKSAPAKKTAPPLPWSTIHVFGYGESQAIGKEINGKAPNSDLKAIAPLLESLAKKQQKGTKIKMDALHALNIFNGMFIDFHSRDRENKSQRFAWTDVDSKQINKLADEIKAKIKAAPQPTSRTNPAGGEARVQALLAKRKSVAAKAKK